MKMMFTFSVMVHDVEAGSKHLAIDSDLQSPLATAQVLESSHSPLTLIIFIIVDNDYVWAEHRRPGPGLSPLPRTLCAAP